MKKIKLMLFASAFIVALAGAFAFSMPGMYAKPNTVFYYNSDSYELADMQDIEKWEASGPSCGELGDLPCSIDFNGDETAFATFLANSDETEILDRAEGKRTVIP